MRFDKRRAVSVACLLRAWDSTGPQPSMRRVCPSGRADGHIVARRRRGYHIVTRDESKARRKRRRNEATTRLASTPSTRLWCLWRTQCTACRADAFSCTACMREAGKARQGDATERNTNHSPLQIPLFITLSRPSFPLLSHKSRR